MANSLTTNPIIINVEGIISVKPIWIKMVRFLPNANADNMTFTYWDEEGTPDHTVSGKTTTLSTATFTSTGNFASGAPAANDIMRMTLTSTGNNQFTYQASAAGDNDDFVMDTWNTYHGTLTDEASKVYSWKIWTPKVAFDFDGEGTLTTIPITIDFGHLGHRFPNLAMHTMDASATAEIYVR